MSNSQSHSTTTTTPAITGSEQSLSESIPVPEKHRENEGNGNIKTIHTTLSDAEISLPTNQHELIAEYEIIADSDVERRVSLSERTGVDGESKWDVIITEYSDNSPPEKQFHKSSPSWNVIEQAITECIKIAETNHMVVTVTPAEHYEREWQEIALQESGAVLTRISDCETDTPIETASKEFHRHRIRQEDGTFNAKINHAVQISPTQLALKVTAFGETRIMELPSLNTPVGSSAWNVHKSIIESGAETLSEDSVITLEDYTDTEITVTVCNNGESTSDGGTPTQLTCTVNDVDYELTLSTVSEYLREKRQLQAYHDWQTGSFNSNWSEHGTPSAFHYAISKTGAVNDFLHVFEAEMTPETSTTDGVDSTPLPSISMFAAYHTKEQPVPCTVTVNEDRTNKDVLGVSFTPEGVDVTLTREYTLPKPDTDAAKTEVLVNELGGGEVKYIDGETVYAVPQNAHSSTDIARDFATDAYTLGTVRTTPEVRDHEWRVFTPSQNRFWRTATTHSTELQAINTIKQLTQPLSLLTTAAVTLGILSTWSAVPVLSNATPVLLGVMLVFAGLTLLSLGSTSLLTHRLENQYPNQDVVRKYMDAASSAIYVNLRDDLRQN